VAGVTPDLFWKWTGGTRFVMTVGAGLVDTMLLLLGKLTGEQYVMLTMGTVAVYIGAAAHSRAKEVENAQVA